MDNYGKELIIDLHDCNPEKFTREWLKKYFKELCELIDMKRCKLVFWDDMGVPDEDKQTLPHTTGTSAVQFILTSNVTVHTLDLMKRVYINIFSCKDFDHMAALKYSGQFFESDIVAQWKVIDRA